MIRSLALAAATAALVLGVGLGCKKEKKDANRGLPPAKDWNAPTPGQGAPGGSPHGGNPHAGNPHMGNPHAGVPGAPQGNPHAGVPGAPQGNPHAGVPGAPGGAPHAGGGVDVSQLGLPAPNPNRKIDPNKYLAGQITVPAKLAARAKPGAVIFLSVKRADANGKPSGAPLAVEKLTVGKMPMAFKLTEAQAMIGGTSFAGSVVVTAWIDQDGDAMSKQPGDLIGQVAAKIPAKGLKLSLDQIRK